LSGQILKETDISIYGYSILLQLLPGLLLLLVSLLACAGSELGRPSGDLIHSPSSSSLCPSSSSSLPSFFLTRIALAKSLSPAALSSPTYHQHTFNSPIYFLIEPTLIFASLYTAFNNFAKA
jgi:hypothetical protein